MNTNRIYAESIVNEYSKKEDSKVVRLKKLDRKVKRPANLFTSIYGTISALVLGTGMCFSMEVLGDGSSLFIVLGIVIGVVGIIGCLTNYPIYKHILEKNKEKYAGDIIELAKEIEKEE